MPATDTVAKLNQVGGKSSDARQFRARVSGLFSPEKPAPPAQNGASAQRRSPRGLQLRRPSQNVSLGGRRNSLSSPDDSPEAGGARKQSKKRTMKKMPTEKRQSPLKNKGYDIQLQDNPEVNLHDSPSKNTRSRNHNPLNDLAKLNLPIPDSMARENNIRVENAEKEHPRTSLMPKQREETRKRRFEETSETGQPDLADERNSKRSKARGQGAEAGDSDGEQSPEHVQDKSTQNGENQNGEAHVDSSAAVVDDASGSQPLKRKPGRPRKETDEQRQERLVQESVRAQEQREEAEKAFQRKFEKKGKAFVKKIEKPIGLNLCTDSWRNIGAAMHMIRDLAPEKPASDRGGSFVRAILRLVDAYKHAREESPISETKNTEIATCLREVKARYDLLRPTHRAEEDRNIVKDIYLLVIPGMVILLKNVIIGRYREKEIYFDYQTLKDLVLILDLSIDICQIARNWEPQPSTLDSGVKKWVKNDILANLKRLQKSYLLDLQRYDRVVESKLVMDRLKHNQERAREALEQLKACRALKTGSRAQSKRNNLQPTTISSASSSRPMEAAIHNVDDFDEALHETHTASEKPIKTTGAAREQRMRLTRAPTIEIPPPLSVDMSYDEKVALLNGLQRYTGETRYADILSDREFGQYLRKHDLDDLVTAARSFSQMIASKVGMDAYRSDDSYMWLRSTDPDV